VPEKRVVLANCGVIDPEDIASYIKRDGFKALKKALKLPSEKVVEEIKASGLRGRGGAGFPCGLKWDLARKAQGNEKYVICNADEGEVGTFKDRYILENDPFSLIEGIAIAGHAVGAEKAYIYLRAEYRFLLALLEGAIAQVKKKGFLKHLDIEVRLGAGAYVCGEESALMDSIEGKRGEVRYRPPFPPTSGLWGKPTIINNVETLMNIPRIVLKGAGWFGGMGTEKSKGTKVFSVSGDVGRPGVYELVLGSSLKELVEDLALAKKVQAVQVGGATGRIIPYGMLDSPLSFETILGAGAVTVFDKSRDMIDIIHRTMEFLAEESCGKCAPCREGTEAMAGILERFSKGEGLKKDITVLGELADTMMLASMCGLGQAAPIPVMDSLKHFRGAYDKRIR
jgi:NADH:ubiquinone oxidoreductase subunit F (NADH-binding)